jgi:hypothetical protein
VNRPSRVPVFVWPLIVTLGLALVAILLSRCWAKVEVTVPDGDLPAGRLIEESDLTNREIDGWNHDDDEVFGKDADLVGHVVRKGLADGRPIPKDAVTREVDADRYRKSVLVELRPEKMAAVDVKPGDLVAIRLAPSGDAEGLAPTKVHAILVDDAKGASGGRILRLALYRGDVPVLLRLAGRAVVLLTRP